MSCLHKAPKLIFLEKWIFFSYRIGIFEVSNEEHIFDSKAFECIEVQQGQWMKMQGMNQANVHLGV